MKFADYLREKKEIFAFSTLYGALFVNYIDLVMWLRTEEPTPAYHVWLIVLYFVPYAIPYLKGTLTFWEFFFQGLYVSLLNDLIWGIWKHVFFGLDLGWYYSRWLLPLSDTIGKYDYGIFRLEGKSWMMCASIYARIAALVAILKYRLLRQ